MVDAFGVTGYEGMFRRTCEVTMRMLRREVDSLMPVLTTFIYDPLVEQKQAAFRSLRNGAADQQQAAHVVQDVENRLRGTINKGIPLSVEGQVNRLYIYIYLNTNPYI